MKLAILGPGEKWRSFTTNRLYEEAKKAGIKTTHISLVDLKLKIGEELDLIYNGDSVKRFDYVLPRIDSKRARIGYSVIRFLDEFGVEKPYPAETVLIAHNKFLTLERMVANGLNVPESYMTGSRKSAKEILGKQKFPIMIKLLSGFGGKGVILIESKEAACSVIETMKTLKQEVLIEKFLKNPGEDIRGMVAGDEIVASYKRRASQEDVRANIYSGGRGVPFKLTPEMEEIAFRAARAIKARLCAIDMIESKEGISVLEANINPGIGGIEKTTDINVAKRIIDFVAEETKR